LILKGKESWPIGDPALVCGGGPGFDFTPERWCLLLDDQWNNGMLEKWNIGFDRRMMF
jgi:hypothetical protein